MPVIKNISLEQQVKDLVQKYVTVSGVDFDSTPTIDTNTVLNGTDEILLQNIDEVVKLPLSTLYEDIENNITLSTTGVTLASVTDNYLTISGQVITAGQVPISLGGTGATSASGARSSLGIENSKWTALSNNIYYNGGNVGIGYNTNTQLSAKLHINGNLKCNPGS